MNKILSLWENNKNFKIEENEKIYDSVELDMLTERIKNEFLKIDGDWKNKTVYMDIKSRKFFIFLFIVLLKLKAKVVLLPIEIACNDVINDRMIYISDNKKTEEGIFLNDDHKLIVGSEFKFTGEKQDNDGSLLYLYTSGSTGKAKLIPKKDFNLFCELKELEKILNLTGNKVFYFTPPLYHIYGLLFGFLLPLYAGGHLVIDYHFTPESVAKFVSERTIDIFVSIPAYYNMFADLNLFDGFKNISAFTSSSAPLSVEISKKFMNENIKITEIYGSTETGGIAYRTGALSESWKLFSYVDIIDSGAYENNSDEDCPPELLINSPAISVLYDGETGYSTGDLVEFTGVNTFKLSGRNTRFVKIKGKRVDLNHVFRKVINYLKSLSNFEIKDDNLFIGEKDELIFVIFEFNFPKNNSEMKKELKDILPGYSVPKYFISMTIPKNSMGKINKAAINDMVEKMKNK